MSTFLDYGRILCRITTALLVFYIAILPYHEASAGDLSPAEVLSFSRVDRTLEFTVVSTGCTTRDHFRLEVTPESPGGIAPALLDSEDPITSAPLLLTLIKTGIDHCRRMPEPKRIEIDLPEIYPRDSTVVVMNPFIAFSSRTRR